MNGDASDVVNFIVLSAGRRNEQLHGNVKYLSKRNSADQRESEGKKQGKEEEEERRGRKRKEKREWKIKGEKRRGV